MTNSPTGRPPRRRGFLASLSEALAPQPIPDDDTGPLVAPKGIIAAMVMAIAAGVAYLFWGGFIVAQIDTMMRTVRADYADQVQDCTAQFGGIGTTAVTAQSPTGLAQTCQQTPVMQATDWDGIETANIILAVVFMVMGALLVLGGWFLRQGRAWARRTVVWITILTLLAAFLLGVTSALILAATLLLLVAVVLCYISSGATFFLRVKERKHT